MKVHLKSFDGTRRPVGQTFLSAGSPDFPVRCGIGRLESRPRRQAGKPALRHQRGIALVVTLILLTVITFLAVAFLFLSRRERGAVTTAVEMTSARLAAEAATERAKAEMVARMIATTNAYNYDLMVSTNYFNELGFQPGVVTIVPPNVNFPAVSNVNYFLPNGNLLDGSAPDSDLAQNIANLFYSPRPPVFVDTNRVGIPANQRGPLDFRYWLDLNRNGRFETNGLLPELDFNGFPLTGLDTNGSPVVLSNQFVGDPEWVGLLERTDRPHGPDNKFISRMAFIAVPEGKGLDINTIHNQSKLLTATGDGFSRNMGVGPFELNLAAFLVDLNTNFWNPVGAPYFYNTNAAGLSLGTAFEDATGLVRYRYDGGWNNLRSVNQLFGNAGADAFRTDLADGYGAGPLMADEFLPQLDGDNPNRVTFGWPGADNPNHFFTTQELFDRTKTSGQGQTPGNNFSDRLRSAGFGTSTYDRYTYYRLLSQLGTDSGPEPAKLHLNYRNVDNAGRIQPNAQTNFVPWQRMDFFTNAADRLLRATFPNRANNARQFGLNDVLSITNVPVVISNTVVYSPAVHRIFQQVANIMDATTNYSASAQRGGADLPTVLRPRFETRTAGGFTDVYIRDWVEVDNYISDALGAQTAPLDPRDPVDLQVIQAAAQFNGNLYGVPWVISAKKGFPNFNEFAMQSIAQITRKLQVRKPTAGGRPTSTNQMFVIGISNVFAAEAWNSYRSAYDRAVDIVVSNDVRIHFTYTNDTVFDLRGGQGTLDVNLGGTASLNPLEWPGYGASIKVPNTNSFLVPLATNIAYLPNSIYRMNGAPPFFTGQTNVGAGLFLGFEQGLGFPIPQFTFAVSNRVRFIMLDRDTQRIVDYVQLNDMNGIRNLSAELPASNEPVIAGNNRSVGGESMFWMTNRAGANTLNTPPIGVVNQIQASLGNLDVANWNSYGQGQAAGATKNKEIDAFRVFMGLRPLYYPGTVNTNDVMQAPFTPTRKTSQYISWQANDPLVHFMAGDLLNLAEADSLRRELPNGPIQPIPNIGKLNKRYEPWGGYPGSSAVGESASPVIPPYAIQAKDPGVFTSDDWDFPTNKFPSVGWLGRVHRGTPWQTVYLKASDVETTVWSKWTGNSNRLDVQTSRPVYDRLLFNVFTAAFDEDSTRGQLNVNQEGLAAWSAGLAGVIGLTNVSTDQQLTYNPPVILTRPEVIQPAGVSLDEVTNTVVGKIWSGINRTRNSQAFKGSFKNTADILATPELTVASPLLNTATDVQYRRGLTDATVERLPQMLMGLLRGNDQPRFTVYAYGQSLKPANRSIITSGPFAGMCTNYQVTAEFATRTVVRIEGAPNNPYPRAVVESFNVLPPDE